MNSLLKNAEPLGLTYTAYASTINGDYSSPDKGFDDDSKYYLSKDGSGCPPNQWWQVSFSKDVSIIKYIIKTIASYGSRLHSWIINASFDNETWKTVDAVTNHDTGGNTTPFELDKAVKCRHFRIVGKGNSSGNNVLHFTYFDCFGKLSSSNKIKCTKFCVYLSQKLFLDVFLSSLTITTS